MVWFHMLYNNTTPVNLHCFSFFADWPFSDGTKWLADWDQWATPGTVHTGASYEWTDTRWQSYQPECYGPNGVDVTGYTFTATVESAPTSTGPWTIVGSVSPRGNVGVTQTNAYEHVAVQLFPVTVANPEGVVYKLTTTTSAPAVDTRYQLLSQKGQPNGYAGLDSGAHVATVQLGSGSATSSTFLRGDSSWAAGAGGGGGAAVQIARQVLNSATAPVTFSSIPGTYNHLQIVAYGRTSYTGDVYSRIRLQMNGDTGSNYGSELVYWNANAGMGGRGTYTTYLEVGFMTSANGPSNHAGTLTLYLPEYGGTTFYKEVHGTGSAALGSTATDQYATLHGGRWRSASAITSLALMPESGNFVAGSTFTLYGLT